MENIEPMETPKFSELQQHELLNLCIRLFNGNTQLLNALADMVNQHFIEGVDGALRHTFMSSDEGAIELLQLAGYAEETQNGYRVLWEKLQARKQLSTKTLTWKEAVTMCVSNDEERARLLAMS